MAYSADLRQRVIDFVEQGETLSEAVRLYNVSRWCVNQWCKTKNLTPNYPKRRKRKLDWHGLKEHVNQYPDALLRERADCFWSSSSCYLVCHERNEINSKKKLFVTVKENIEKELNFCNNYENKSAKMVLKIIFI